MEKKEEKKTIKTYVSFDDMKLKTELLRGIYSYGFEKPSSIQKKAIVPFIEQHDLIAQSQSGTGKTGAFTVGMLQRVDTNVNETQGLILAPTRELAKQIHTVIELIGKFINNLRIKLSIGGTRNRYNKWNDNVKNDHIIIGTPGRVLDNISRNRVDINHLKVFCLDEADEMLSRGFVDQIYRIFQKIPTSSQICLFSATLPDEILEMTEQFIKNPVNILVKREELTLEGIRQYYVAVDRYQYKQHTFLDIFSTINITQSIVFVNRKRDIENLYNFLISEDFPVSLIMGSMDQEERNQVISNFREGKSRVLLSTGLLARGFDVQQVSLVVNYDIPRDKEQYTHACGRTGRYRRKGVVINFVTEREYELLNK